jgi:hypothetical protein
LRAEGDPPGRPGASPDPPPSGAAPDPAPSATAEVNIAVIRQLLLAAFDDEDFTDFCFDHFPEVHNKFSSGMSRSGKVRRLIDYCQRRLVFAELLALVESENPAQYQKFSPFIFDT